MHKLDTTMNGHITTQTEDLQSFKQIVLAKQYFVFVIIVLTCFTFESTHLIFWRYVHAQMHERNININKASGRAAIANKSVFTFILTQRFRYNLQKCNM